MPQKTQINKAAARVRYALSLRGVRQAGIAKKLSVSPTAVYETLNMPRKSARVRKAVADALGFHPWLEFASQDGWTANGKKQQGAA